MRFPGIVVFVAIATLGAVGEAAETTRLPALFNEEARLDSPRAKSPDADALAERSLDIGAYNADERAEYVAQGLQLLQSGSGAGVSAGTRAKFALAQSYLNYQAGQVEAALKSIGRALRFVTLQRYPDLYVRIHSFYGGLLLLSGDQDRGLNTLNQLLSADLSAADPLRVQHARVNYASALALSGDLEKAAGYYEEALQYGLDAGQDRLALSAGSNYVVHLTDQKLFGEANYWLAKLSPAMERLPGMMAVGSLKLQEFGVLIYFGQAEQAIDGLRAYVDDAQGGPVPVIGHGYEYLGAALREADRLQESLTAAEKAVELLAPLPIEAPEAKMKLVRTLLELGRYQRAGDVLDSISVGVVNNAAGIDSLRELRLRHTLGEAGFEQAESEFLSYLQSSKTLSDFLSARNSGYYSAKLTTQRQSSELALLTEQKAMLAAEAKANQAVASELIVREQAGRTRRNYLLLILSLLAAALLVFVYVNGNRRAERKLRLQEQAQNEKLSLMVEEKSEALMVQVLEQSKLEQELNESRRMESIGHLTGNLAHDFNNLLQVVSSANEMLEGVVVDAPFAEMLQASNKSVATGSSIIRQLLAYSRRQELAAKTVVVSSYFEGTSALFQSAIGEVNTLLIDDETRGACVRLDTSQLTSAILNLLRNAVDAMSKPGEIRVNASLRVLDDQPTPLNLELEPGEYVQIQVNDQGCGMNEEERMRALEPYFTTKGDESGTGLGLSSVYGFVKQSGGDMIIASEVGIGTTVTLLFPESLAATQSEPSGEYSIASLTDSRILVVEDNELVAQTLLAILDTIGARVQRVATTDLAQKVLQGDAEFDFLLSDVHLPGRLDGFGLANWTKTHCPGIHVILMSGYGQSEDGKSEHAFLSKPFTRKQLLDFVARQVA